MKLLTTALSGLFEVQPFVAEDSRGTLVKFFSKQVFDEYHLDTNFVESYYSVSQMGVIRGMHFQLPPHDHAKMIYVTHGVIQDVVLDIRKDSPTFGKHVTFTVSAENKRALYISPGMAHGFESLADNTAVTYLQTSYHSASHDVGILYNSFGMNWKTKQPIISDRDKVFPSLSEFTTPFVFDPTEPQQQKD